MFIEIVPILAQLGATAMVNANDTDLCLTGSTICVRHNSERHKKTERTSDRAAEEQQAAASSSKQQVAAAASSKQQQAAASSSKQQQAAAASKQA